MKNVKLYEDFSDNEDEVYQTLQGYLECALWIEELEEYSISDIDSLSTEQARDDIDKFLDELDENDLLDELVSQMGYSSVGHDFWLTRNGHGTGFWDNSPLAGEEITKICENFDHKDVFEENGKIYIN